MTATLSSQRNKDNTKFKVKIEQVYYQQHIPKHCTSKLKEELIYAWEKLLSNEIGITLRNPERNTQSVCEMSIEGKLRQYDYKRNYSNKKSFKER